MVLPHLRQQLLWSQLACSTNIRPNCLTAVANRIIWHVGVGGLCYTRQKSCSSLWSHPKYSSPDSRRTPSKTLPCHHWLQYCFVHPKYILNGIDEGTSSCCISLYTSCEFFLLCRKEEIVNQNQKGSATVGTSSLERVPLHPQEKVTASTSPTSLKGKWDI